MKLTATLILVAFAAFGLASASPVQARRVVKLEVRAPADDNPLTSKSQRTAKCLNFCNSGIPPVQNLDGLTWGHGPTFGSQPISNFNTFQSGFQSLATVSQNTASVWQSGNIQFGQIQQQLQVMVINYYRMVSQLQGGCSFCTLGGQDYGFQFQNTISQFFIQVQGMLSIITSQFPGALGQLGSIFQILNACIQATFGVVNTLGISIGSVIGNLDLGVFQNCGINFNSFINSSPMSLFNSVGSVQGIVQQTTQNNFGQRFGQGFGQGFGQDFGGGSAF